MPWGWLGPIEFRTKRGTRVTFVAGFITLPITALSLYSLLHGKPQQRQEPPRLGAGEVDLSDK